MNNTPAANIPEGVAPGYEDDGSSDDSGFSVSSIQNVASSILDALSHPSFLQGGTVIAPDYTPRQLDDDASDVPIQEANPTYQPYAASTALNNFIQDHTTVIAPNYTPRPLDDSVYSDIPGTPVASGQFGELEDENVRDERMKDSADYMAANWPRLYGGAVGAAEGFANVVGGIQNAVGGGNGILDNVQKAEEGMQNYREQWNDEYGDSYFLNPNKFATDVGSGIGSTVPVMALSALMPGAAVAGGTRALTAALSRAGLGRLAMSKAGQALIADTVRSPISSLADSLSEYGTVVNDMMQSGMSEDEARRKAMPMFFKNMALDTLTVPIELGVMKGGKGIAAGLLGRGAEEGIGKSLAKGAARTGMLAGASGLTEGYQEGAQNALENDVQGKRDGGWYNPFTWTNEDWEAARGGFVGGALMGVPGNVAAGFHPEARQAPLSAESREQAQSIKDTLSHGKPKGMSNAAYNAYIELANSGNPDLIKQAASSLESFQKSQGNSSSESTDDAATEAYKDYEAYDQKQEIENFLNNNTVEQIGGEDNYNWLYGVLRNGTPEEVQKAYNDVIAAEKVTAEQEAKNRPARSGGSVSPSTGNAMVNAVIQAANDSGVDPRLALAIAARESGGDDINAIHMPDPHDGIYGIMQAQDETVADLGLDSQYPDWQTDPYQNAMVGMAILKSKIANEDGDVWAGVRDYNGAGEEAEQYRQLVKNNYDNMGDIGGGGNVEVPSEAFYDLSDAMNPQVDGMDPNTMAKMNLLARDFYQKYGHRLLVTSLKRNGDGSSYHDEGHAFDFSDDFLEQNPDARDWLVQQGEKYGLKGLDEFSHPVATTDGGNVHFTDHGGPVPGGASGAVAGKITSDDGQFDRELDQDAQEAKSDMDKIQAQSDQAMNEIMNDDSTEKTAQEAREDAENAQKQAAESQQSTQDAVVPDVAQTIRDTSNNIDEINTLDGMFTKDSNGNDKFIDTPENRDFIKANYKDEITKAVNDAMSKKKAPIATPVPKNKQQTPHARLGRILATYDRKDPMFKEYMNTFRNGTEQEQRKLADDLQTTQELERANSLKGNPLASQQDQNTPPNAPQQGVEAPEQSEQVNTPTQVKESLETQKKRNAYLSKKQKLMERVPSGRTVKVHASTNDAGFDATYKIVPAGDITASHNTDYAVNDLYPAELQPRDRNRPQMRGQVEKMAKTMKPELLAESQFVNEGAPIVNNSGVVLNGNGRVMAIQKAYQGLTDSHKKSAKAYKDFLASIAPSLGIAPEKVQSMEHPVLVRQAADDADTNAIINSTEGGAKLGGAEQAKTDADRLKLSTLEQFVDNGTGEFMNLSNREFRRMAAKDIFSDAEGNSVFNANGELSPIGALRIRNAIFAKAYEDDYLLTQLSEATDNNSKNIMNAMIAAAPEVAKVNEGIKEGNLHPDYDISDVITKTAKTIMSLRNEGKPLSFHLQETSLFSQGESEAERLVLEFIERNKFKNRTIADMYKAVCDRIFAVGSPKQSKLFDITEAPRISFENIISNAIQEVEHGQSLFDTTEEKPAEKAVSEVPDNRQAEPAGSGRVHQQEAGRVQSQEKEGNEVDEKSKQSDHVNAEPQQTESKDKESSHAEEGSQGGVQAQQDVNDAALSIGGKIFQLIERRKPRRYDKKAIFHYLKSVYITPYEENGAYYIDIDNLEIEKTIKVSKKDYDYAVKYTKDEKWVGSYYQQQENKEIKKAAPKDDVVVTGDEFGKYEGLKELRAKAKAYYKEHLQGTSVHNSILGNVELKDDSIDFTGKGISKAVSTSAKENKLLLIKYLPQLIENANEVASQPNVKDKREAKQYTYLMTHAIVGGKRENVIVTIFTDANGNKYYNHILNDEENKKRPPVYPAQAANKSDGIPAMREPFSTSIIPQKAEKWNKPDELRNQLSDGGKQAYEKAMKETTLPKEDIRFGTVEEAEKAVMEAFGVKEHKKPASTPSLQHKASTKVAPKKTVKKAAIKDDAKIEKTFHLLDDSDEALEAEKKAILEELSHLSANPAFNPVLMYHLLKVGAIHVQRGLNEFARWAKAMKDTLPQSEPFLHSVWDSLQSMPNHAKLDEKQLTAAIRYVGSLYDHGMTDKVDLRKSFIATLGVKNAKYFDAVYNAVMEYPSIEELKGANDNVNSNVPELVARSGEGASENAVGENRIQGRTAVRGSRQDTAQTGKEPQKQGMGHDSLSSGSTATGRTAGNRRVQTQESKDSTGSTGSTELPGSVRAGLERVPDDDQRRPAELVRVAQNRPQHEDPVNKVQEEQKDKHLNEIKKALPMLLPQQAEDVCIAENRFKDHSGMMFTNGTGTGKTYTGLGVVKRFVDAGKKNILIIAPSDGILKQWEEAATKDFGITLTRLNSTKDAGNGAVTATYANVGANQALVNRDFDLVITDESHNLMGSESATPTDALKLVRAVTGHKDGFQRYHHDKHPEISSKLDKLHEEIKKLRKRDSQIDKERKETHDPSLNDESRKIRDKIEKLEEEMSKWHEKLEAFKGADEKAFAEKQPSKILFLSATPFQYVADLDYANGYLFDYADYGPMEQQGYNQANGRENFYIENFGYKMRYNRLERPGSDVDTDLMEREFNRKMVESGAMHGRMLSSSYDYDRGFIRIDAGVGQKIDEGFQWLRNRPKYRELSNFLEKLFTGQQKYYLLEAIKAKQAIPLIKKYINSGKKVVIFHNFNKGGADNPFVINREGMDYLESLDSERADDILKQYHDFQVQRPDLASLDLNGLESPIKTLSKAFDDELVLYNGTLSKGEREKNKNSFNNDDSKVKVILVQSAAGQAGVSLHDTTGNYQRVLINLGLPTRPSEAIQQEGRIYRVGNKSNAIFRYLNTGTYMEQMAFATKLAERAGTVENIALGEMARSLKQAYVEAFEESQEGDEWKKYLPGSKTEGTGGKANDYRQEKATDFDRAKAVYFGKQKKNSRTKSREGVDYFATPEPIGYKMVQWLQAKPGQSLLEPSAGDGAIARWMPDNTYNTVVEPSRDLTPKLMRNVAGAKVVESTFENFDLHNKFDGIAMNPPFGHGGKTAVEHVAKAYQHLKDGGRLIAILPDGSACQKHFDKWFYGDPEAKRKADRGIADGVLMADIHLPSVTFDRAGTNVNTRMVVIDKCTDEGTRQVAEAEARGRIDIAADDVNELFDRIEDMNMPERLDMSDEKKQASIRKVGQQLTRSKEDLKAEIKEAFPNAKEIKDEGERMTFTMPNGSHIVVDMKNEIVLTDKELAQAKKDHHIDDNGNVVVEGYAEVHGKDAYMALAQGSREGTGFHEAYHLAEGAVLTDREKAAIKKAIPDAEKRADKYAEWVEARKRGRGTAWGKLFQKIKDFAAKMKKIFNGAETVNDVFRQIESGEVWERNAKASNVAWTSVTNTAITGKTRVPIVDVSNWGRMNLTNTAKKKAIIEELKGASFKFIDSQGRFATKLDSKHFVNSSSSIQIHLKTRQKIFSNIGEILNNAIYVEKHPDVRHGKSGEYIELFSAVKDGGKIVLFRIVAKEGDKTVGRYNIGDVKFYDILQQKKDVPHHLSHSDRQNGGTSLDTVSVSDLLRNVNDRHNRPYVNSDGTLNYEFGVLKALPTNKTSYSVRKEGATNSTIDQEEAPVKPQDIIDAINDIVHIYEGSRLTDKERKELRESSKFDPDQKQAVRPQATDLYDRHAHAGFNRMGYFNLSNYGRILALHLDNVMKLKGNLELTNKILDRQDKNAAENKMNGVSEHLTPSQARQNAVMDFGAMMIRNPELARETYPAYAKIFDEGLEKHPDLKEKLDRVIQLNETYQGQTAAERATGSIAREREKVQLRKHPKEWLHTHFDKFYTNWVDDKHIFAKIVAKAEAELGRKLAYDYDVHKQAQMALNVASSRALLFLTGGKSTEDTYEVLNTVYGHAITKNVTMKDIMDALNKVSKEDVSKTGAENAYDALGNYLIAMRTEELEKHYHDAYARSAGFDEEGTREIIQNTPESIKKIAQMYWDINTNIVNILQQQGLISKDLAGKLRKYKHYCPMYRDMSDGITDMDEMIGTIGAFNKGGGYANVNNGIKRIEGGGKRPILDPITSLSQMAVSMISKCERNDVAKTFVKLGQDFSGLGDIVVRDPTLKHADPTAFAFTVWQNGEQVVYRTTPEIYDALTNNDAQANRFTIKIASSIAHTLRTGATISPSFIVRNLLRDTMSATVNSKTGFYLPFVDNVRGAWKLHFDKEFSAEYHASGASMSTYMRADADSSRDLTKELLGHKYDSYPVVVKQVRQLISWAWHKYEKFGNLIEDSTRAGEFRRARNQGLSIDQAGQLAREITLDFSRHGKKGQIVNKYVPFFNATIQGTDKFIRTFKDNPMRAILNTVIWIILPSLVLWAINHDDDWYKELDENTKYTSWAIPLPGGTHLLIPKPQEVGILFGSGIEAVLNQMTGTDPHGVKEWARQYAEAMTPSLYPAVARPLIEWMTNYSFWTGRNLVPASLQKAPSEMQFTSYTSELAKSLGDTWLAKNIKLSPIAIDNWISGWFGSAGRFVANMLNDPISYVRGNSRPSEPAKYWYEMPVIGSFIRQNGQNSEYVNRMYEIQKDMNDDYERSDAGKQRKGKKASSSKPKDLKQVDTAVSSVSKLNKEIKAIRNDPKKDPDQKRREIDQRRTKINDLAKKVVLKFDK